MACVQTTSKAAMARIACRTASLPMLGGAATMVPGPGGGVVIAGMPFQRTRQVGSRPIRNPSARADVLLYLTDSRQSRYLAARCTGAAVEPRDESNTMVWNPCGRPICRHSQKAAKRKNFETKIYR